MRQNFNLNSLQYGWKPLLSALVILVAGLSLTAYRTQVIQQDTHEKSVLKFKQYVDRIEDAIQTQFKQPLFGIRGAIGAQASLGGPTAMQRSNFRAYVAARDIAIEFPGIRGFGYVERVMRSQLSQFEATEKADQAPDFTVNTRGDAPDLYIIKYVEPLTNNREAVGLDLGAEPVRREAVERAIATGEPSLSGDITLMQDGRKSPGFLYLVPVFAQGTKPDTPQARHDQLIGLFYSPLVAHELLRSSVPITHGDVDFELFDGPTASPKTLVFSSQQSLANSAGVEAPTAFAATRAFHETRALVIGGRLLTLRTGSSNLFDADLDHLSSLRVSVGGTLLSLLLAVITWLLLVGRSRAETLARSMTADRDRLAGAEKVAQQALTLEHERLNNIIMGTRAGTWEWNGQTGEIVINDRWAEIMGYALQALQPVSLKTWTEHCHPDDLQRANQLLAQHLAGSLGYYDCEVRMRHRDGHWVWVHTRGKTSSWTADGKPEWMSGTSMDISEQKLAEEETARSAAMLQSVLNAASEVAVITAGLDRVITLFNTGAERMLGYTAAEVVGQHTSKLFLDPEEVKARSAALSVELNRPVAETSVMIEESMLGKKTEWTFIRKDGHRLVVALVATKLFDTHGVCTGYLGISNDISTEKDYENWLRTAMQEAEAATIVKSQFLANMSHEIRTPMNAILGMLKLLLNTELSPRQLDYATKTESAAKSLLGLINNILDFSKMDVDKMVLDPQPFRIDHLISELSVILSANVGPKPVSLVFDIDPAIPETLVGDAIRLQQVLINLGGNAIKFTEQGEVVIQIKVLAQTDANSTLQVSVRDNGIGIAPENQQHIFDGFSQAEASTTRRFGGTGLGLSICKRLVALMGGELALDSALGQGSTFHFNVTLLAADQTLDAPDLRLDAVAGPPIKPAKIRRLEGLRLLIVEDNLINQQVAQELLSAEGALIEIACNGQLGVAAVAHAVPPFDAVLMDLQMPVMDGYAATRAIRHELGLTDLPVIAMTANAMASDREACLAAGMNDHIGKPFDLPHLIAVLQHLTDHPTDVNPSQDSASLSVDDVATAC